MVCAFCRYARVRSVVFLFKYMRSVQSDAPLASEEHAAGVYFCKQIVNNACATQALIAILLVSRVCCRSAVCALVSLISRVSLLVANCHNEQRHIHH